MKTLSILICSLFLTACGLRTVEKKSVNIHPELQAYAKSFEQKGGVRIDNLNMTFGQVDGAGSNGRNVLGFCQSGVKEVYVKGGLEKHVYNIRNVVIDIDDWNRWVSEGGTVKANRELLSFHEMGHCVLNRGHTTASNSIMQEYHIGATKYTNSYFSLTTGEIQPSYPVYIAELFKKPVSQYASDDSFGGYLAFNGSIYPSGYTSGYIASVSSYNSSESLIGKTEFVEPEIVIPHESELKGGCTHELEPEVIHEEETESEPESNENL